jgi:hypothetical protein
MKTTKASYIRSMSDEGLSIEEIAKKTGYLPLYVYQVVREHKGLYKRSRKAAKPKAVAPAPVESIELSRDVGKIAIENNLPYAHVLAINSIVKGKVAAAIKYLKGMV